MKILKNKLTIALSIFLCLAMFLGNGMVSYAAGQTVTITSVSASTTTVTVAGETLAAAVMVQIRDASDAIVAMQSFGTLDDKFSGSITGLSLTAGATYTVYVADYEGGTWAIQTVTPVQAAPGGGGGGNAGANPSSSSSQGTAVTTTATPGGTTTTTVDTPSEYNDDGVALNPDGTPIYTAPNTGDPSRLAWCLALLLVGVMMIACNPVLQNHKKHR